MRPLPCTAEHPCWESYQGWHTRVTSRDINLAISLTFFAAKALEKDLTIEAAQRVQDAAKATAALIGRQWREMTREPFLFPKPTPLPVVPKGPATLDDLME